MCTRFTQSLVGSVVPAMWAALTDLSFGANNEERQSNALGIWIKLLGGFSKEDAVRCLSRWRRRQVNAIRGINLLSLLRNAKNGHQLEARLQRNFAQWRCEWQYHKDQARRCLALVAEKLDN